MDLLILNLCFLKKLNFSLSSILLQFLPEVVYGGNLQMVVNLVEVVFVKVHVVVVAICVVVHDFSLNVLTAVENPGLVYEAIEDMKDRKKLVHWLWEITMMWKKTKMVLKLTLKL